MGDHGGYSVEVELEGEPMEGYQVSQVSTVPVTVNLVGTQEALARLDGKIVLKDKISVAGALQSITATANLEETLEALDEDLRLPEGSDPTVTITVQIEENGGPDFQHSPVRHRDFEPAGGYDPDGVAFRCDFGIRAFHRQHYGGYYGERHSGAKADFAPCARAWKLRDPGLRSCLPNEYVLTSQVTLVVTSAEPEITPENATEAAEG